MADELKKDDILGTMFSNISKSIIDNARSSFKSLIAGTVQNTVNSVSNGVSDAVNSVGDAIKDGVVKGVYKDDPVPKQFQTRTGSNRISVTSSEDGTKYTRYYYNPVSNVSSSATSSMRENATDPRMIFYKTKMQADHMRQRIVEKIITSSYNVCRIGDYYEMQEEKIPVTSMMGWKWGWDLKDKDYFEKTDIVKMWTGGGVHNGDYYIELPATHLVIKY